MWPFTNKQQHTTPKPTVSPCFYDEKHDYWTKKGWSCPMCAADEAARREASAEDRLARKVAGNVVAMMRDGLDSEVPECFMTLYKSALGITHGHDWNGGTHAKIYRTPLIDATARCTEFIAAKAKEGKK